MFEEIYRDPLEQDTINMIGESIMSKERHLQFFQWLIDHVMISELSPIPSLSLAEAKQVIVLLEYIRDEELKHLHLLQNIISDELNHIDLYNSLLIKFANIV